MRGLDICLSSTKPRQRDVSLSTFTLTSKSPPYKPTQVPNSLQSPYLHEDKYFHSTAFKTCVEHHLADWRSSRLRRERKRRISQIPLRRLRSSRPRLSPRWGYGSLRTYTGCSNGLYLPGKEHLRRLYREPFGGGLEQGSVVDRDDLRIRELAAMCKLM